MASALPSIDDLFGSSATSVASGSRLAAQRGRLPAAAVAQAPNILLSDSRHHPTASGRFGSFGNVQTVEWSPNHQSVGQRYPYSIYRVPTLPMSFNGQRGFPQFRQHQHNYQPRTRRQVWNCDACMRHFFDEPAYQEHLTQHIKCPHKQCKYEAHVNIVIKHFELQHLTGLFERIGKLETPEEISQWRELRKKRFPKSRSHSAQIPCVGNEYRSNTPRADAIPSQRKRACLEENDDDAEDGELTSSDEECANVVGKAEGVSSKSDVPEAEVLADKTNLLSKYEEFYMREVLDYFASSGGRFRSSGRSRGSNFASRNSSKKSSLRDKLVQTDLRRDFEIIKSAGIYSQEQLDKWLDAKRAAAKVKADN